MHVMIFPFQTEPLSNTGQRQGLYLTKKHINTGSNSEAEG